MHLDKKLIADIFKEELIAALGCTEPIAIAYASAKAKEVLGNFPDSFTVACSGNIVKNVKGVVVPNSENLKGIKTAALMGIVAGQPEKKLEVIAQVSKEQVLEVKRLLETPLCKVELIEGEESLAIEVTAKYQEDCAFVQIKNRHTNITKITRNNEIIYENIDEAGKGYTDRSCLCIAEIVDFAEHEDISDLLPYLRQQSDYNLAIAEEGIRGHYGQEVGRTVLEANPDDLFTKVIAYAAAGSDARMSGCSLPVVVNSGSGNQGMTTSIPVLVYAREEGFDEDKTMRALALSNLVTIHLKTGIGRLSAYCGVVSAACGAFSGICYLTGGTLDQIEKTIVNLAGTLSGMICDGAKPSCASKIASALSCGVVSLRMAMKNQCFEQDTGIIKKDIESTIRAIGTLSQKGMRVTDQVILDMMINDD